MRRAPLGMALLLVLPPALISPAAAHPAEPVARVTTFHDGFTGPAGRAPSPERWLHNTGNGTAGWGNHELQWETPGAQNAALDGRGHLVITARRETRGTCWNGRPCRYTSARLMTKTKFAQAYGRFAARIRLPAQPGRSKGYWPAFWALGADIDTVGYPGCGEIDFMESVNGSGLVYAGLHTAVDSDSPRQDYDASYDLRRRQPRGWHVYSADWTPSRITFRVDGHAVGSQTRAQYGDAWQLDKPFFVILDLAVGGDWPGAPNARSRFPMRMVVDYVTVTS